jgi:hypothetical protein
MSEHLKPFAFRPGQSGNPNGRPKGSRNKLSEALLDDLYAERQEQGREAIKKMAEKTPGDFVKVVASLMPKVIGVQNGPLTDLSDEELDRLIMYVQVLNAENDQIAIEGVNPNAPL